MTDLRVIGIDPGPTPGLVLLDYDGYRIPAVPVLERVEALQCTSGLLEDVLSGLLTAGREQNMRMVVQVEAFVTGNRSSRSLVPKASTITRELVTVVQRVCGFAEVPCYVRSAASVKPWAIEERLAASRILEPTKGLRHARDAGRHALFCAVHDGGVPDPLSKRSK